MQHELDMSRMQAQTESLRMQSELLRLQSERMNSETPRNRPTSSGDALQELRELQEFGTKKATEEEAARKEREREEKLAVASAQSADLVYASMVVALPLVFGFLVAKRARAGGTMKHEEKFGVLLMIASLLLAFLAIAISENWQPHFDALQNIMLTLKIRLFPEGESSYSSAMIDVYTKHVLLALAVVAAYGFTTYLGITPAWKKVTVPETGSPVSATKTPSN
jgi:hypothetical protein